MVTFPLQIVTPDGLIYDGDAAKISVRTIEGDVGILARHIDFVTALGMGVCRLDTEESTRYAACMGGLVAVIDGKVRVVATTFEWSDEIDIERAEKAKILAEEIINSDSDQAEKQISQARYRRAVIRLGVSQRF
ncbi:ATP synthase F1 subunit epsilon [Scatolibacter rhodanostii]|uniref:ATP synthase F1 subunit epsilon n=1 Tax=Scatolibacter rhodanostii TaxID=2014781 RepID=UPI000C06F432|nr:ATP synthase F1 subunit epsilon [Scatolibacter rhodanostii]